MTILRTALVGDELGRYHPMYLLTPVTAISMDSLVFSRIKDARIHMN